MISYETRMGTVNISLEYLAKLIGHAVSTCYGVVGMVPHGRQRLIEKFKRGVSINRGIRVSGTADSIRVDLHIVVIYGMNINAIARSIMNKVKYTVEETTGIRVEKVTVKVDGLQE